MSADGKETWTPGFGIVAPHRRKYKGVNKLFTSPIEAPFVAASDALSKAEVAAKEGQMAREQAYVTAQPQRRQDVVPSLIEHNCAKWAEEMDRKEEWEKEGLESGLNPWQFRKRKRDKVVGRMAELMRYSMEESEALFAKEYAKMAQQSSAKAKNSSWLARQTDFKQDTTVVVVKETAEVRVPPFFLSSSLSLSLHLTLTFSVLFACSLFSLFAPCHVCIFCLWLPALSVSISLSTLPCIAAGADGVCRTSRSGVRRTWRSGRTRSTS